MRLLWKVAAVAALCGFSVGSVIGCRHGRELAATMESVNSEVAPGVLSKFALRQFEHADTGHARQAVLLQIGVLKQLARGAPDSVRYSELALAYTRLGVIEGNAGRNDAEQQAFKEARQWYALEAIRWHQGAAQELTDDVLRAGLKRLDDLQDRSPF